jgi:hypothetical protein
VHPDCLTGLVDVRGQRSAWPLNVASVFGRNAQIAVIGPQGVRIGKPLRVGVSAFGSACT